MNRKNNVRWNSTKGVQHTERCYETLTQKKMAEKMADSC